MSRIKTVCLCSAMALGLGLGLTGLAASASAGDYGPFKEMETSLGKVLVDANGMTLYTFDKDTAGTSNCYDTCAENWPPAVASASDKPTGDLTIIKRKDGTLQWADDGKPLYTFKQDAKPGDVTGDKKNDVWHVVAD